MGEMFMDRIIVTESNKENKVNKEIEVSKEMLNKMIEENYPYELILKKSKELDVLIAKVFAEMNYK